MSTLQITGKMASVVKESSRDVFVNLSDQVGGLVLKEEQKLAVEALLSGKDVMAVLPTGFGKYIIYQSFVIAKNFAITASIVVVVPLRSIIEDQLQSNDFGLKAVAFDKIPKLLKKHWCQLVQCNFRIRRTSFVGRIHRRMLKHDINNSFPVVLHHVLHYTPGVCVVDFFYSGGCQ